MNKTTGLNYSVTVRVTTGYILQNDLFDRAQLRD